MRFHLSQEAKDHRLCEIPVSPWHGASARSRVNADRRMSPPTTPLRTRHSHISNMVMTAVVPGRFLGGHILRRIAVTHRPRGYLAASTSRPSGRDRHFLAQYLVRASRAVGSAKDRRGSREGDRGCDVHLRRSTLFQIDDHVPQRFRPVRLAGPSCRRRFPRLVRRIRAYRSSASITSGCWRSALTPQILAHELLRASERA